MKRNCILTLLCLLSATNIHALTVTVTGYGNIPEEGMAITLTEAEEDILTGEMVMGITGSLICNGTLSVSITRSETGLTDEFCCADKCTGGNKEQEETLQFTPGGKAKWYIHYMPASGSETEITYLFSEGTQSRRLTVRYSFGAQALESVREETKTTKILRDGILYIVKDNKVYHL